MSERENYKFIFQPICHRHRNIMGSIGLAIKIGSLLFSLIGVFQATDFIDEDLSASHVASSLQGKKVNRNTHLCDDGEFFRRASSLAPL